MHGWLIISISLSTQYKCIDHKLTLREAIIKNRILSLFKILFQSYKEKEPKSAQKIDKMKKEKKRFEVVSSPERGCGWRPGLRHFTIQSAWNPNENCPWSKKRGLILGEKKGKVWSGLFTKEGLWLQTRITTLAQSTLLVHNDDDDDDDGDVDDDDDGDAANDDDDDEMPHIFQTHTPPNFEVWIFYNTKCAKSQ